MASTSVSRTLNEIKVLLAVFAHPDDEVMVAGTLSRLKAFGTEIHVLYATKGEDGPTGGLVDQADLGTERMKELNEVSKIIGYDTMEVLDYPDRYLPTIPDAEFRKIVIDHIQKFEPDTVICFDGSIGLYGNADHAYTGRNVIEVFRDESYGVERLMIMTLPKVLIKLALRLSTTFKERYDQGRPLPPANFAVRISGFARQKRAVMKAHRTQWQVLNDVMPFWDKMPPEIYHQLFANEYFTLVDLSTR